MSDPAILSEVSADRIRSHIEKIVREIPHRAAGSPNGKRMAEYSRDAMKQNGLTDTVIYELPAIVSFPEHAEFRVESPTEISVQANTLGHSLKTTETVSGERSSTSAAVRSLITPARTRAVRSFSLNCPIRRRATKSSGLPA